MQYKSLSSNTLQMTYKRVLIFDVETTGLLPKGFSQNYLKHYPIHNLPYVVQLSYLVYDFSSKSIVEIFNTYVDAPVEIPPEITKLTGISKKMCQTQGMEMRDVLNKFYQAYIGCDCIIAHNLGFDRNMLIIELERNRENFATDDVFNLFVPLYNQMLSISMLCTMQMSKEYCNIQRTNSVGTYLKFPTLTELHEKLFQETPQNMHNSLMDIFICLKCYLKFQFNLDVPEENTRRIHDEIVMSTCSS